MAPRSFFYPGSHGLGSGLSPDGCLDAVAFFSPQSVSMPKSKHRHRISYLVSLQNPSPSPQSTHRFPPPECACLLTGPACTTPVLFNDLHRFTLLSSRWERLEGPAIVGNPPSPRSHGGLAAVADRLVVFAGSTAIGLARPFMHCFETFADGVEFGEC
jgi:hypothetical protein